MQLTFDARQDIKRLVATAGISLAFIVAQAAPALADTKDLDGDGLPNRVERNVTETNPRDADTDDDGIEDGAEDEDADDVEDGDEDDEDEDDDCDGEEDEDDLDDDNGGVEDDED